MEELPFRYGKIIQHEVESALNLVIGAFGDRSYSKDGVVESLDPSAHDMICKVLEKSSQSTKPIPSCDEISLSDFTVRVKGSLFSLVREFPQDFIKLDPSVSGAVNYLCSLPEPMEMRGRGYPLYQITDEIFVPWSHTADCAAGGIVTRNDLMSYLLACPDATISPYKGFNRMGPNELQLEHEAFLKLIKGEIGHDDITPEDISVYVTNGWDENNEDILVWYPWHPDHVPSDFCVGEPVQLTDQEKKDYLDDRSRMSENR